MSAIARGEELFHKIGCVACHAPLHKSSAQPGTSAAAAVEDEDRQPVDLNLHSTPLGPKLHEKYSIAGLAQFLLDPLRVPPQRPHAAAQSHAAAGNRYRQLSIARDQGRRQSAGGVLRGELGALAGFRSIETKIGRRHDRVHPRSVGHALELCRTLRWVSYHCHRRRLHVLLALRRRQSVVFRQQTDHRPR